MSSEAGPPAPAPEPPKEPSLNEILGELDKMINKACGEKDGQNEADKKKRLEDLQLVQDNLALAVVLEAKIHNNPDFPRAGDVMLAEAERERQAYDQVFGSCKTVDDFSDKLEAIEAELYVGWMKPRRSRGH